MFFDGISSQSRPLVPQEERSGVGDFHMPQVVPDEAGGKPAAESVERFRRRVCWWNDGGLCPRNTCTGCRWFRQASVVVFTVDDSEGSK